MSSAREPADVSAENLIIGGGPAGSMLALRLAAAGRRVMLIEREAAAHDKVCGEFLSREAVHYLRQAGLDPLALGAQVIRTVRLSSGNRVVSSPLPFEALSLSRRTLDEALLTRAAQGCK
ncbi:MAG: NAD(P)/FAD-dependent oxidoreductase, partial [Terracidiphilus sp.]